MRRSLFVIVVIAAVSLLHADLFVINSNSQTLSHIDTNNWSIDNSFAMLGQYSHAAPNRFCVNESTDMAWITVTYENSIQGVSLNGEATRTSIYLEDSAAPWDVKLSSQYAYVSGSGRNCVYKVNLNTGRLAGQIPSGVYPQGLAITNDMLFVCNSGFHIDTFTYDPGCITAYELDGFSFHRTVSCGLNPQCAAVVGDELHVVCTGDYGATQGQVDIFSLDTLEMLDTIAIGGSPGCIAVSGDRVFLGNAWPAGVFEYSASTREIVHTPATSPFVGGNSVLAHGDILVSVDANDYIQNSDVYVYDLTDNSLSHQLEAAVGAVDVQWWTSPVSVDKEEEPSPGCALSLWPNPTREGCSIAYSQAVERPVEASVYNARGQKVRSIALEDGASWWDGRDASGQACPSGVYLVRIVDRGEASVRRLTLIR